MVHLTLINSAGVQGLQIHICQECAEKQELNNPEGFTLSDLLLGLGK